MPGIFARRELNAKACQAVADLIDQTLEAGWEIDNDGTIWGNSKPDPEDVSTITTMIKHIAWRLRDEAKR